MSFYIDKEKVGGWWCGGGRGHVPLLGWRD